jgi:hypothetical protein
MNFFFWLWVYRNQVGWFCSIEIGTFLCEHFSFAVSTENRMCWLVSAFGSDFHARHAWIAGIVVLRRAAILFPVVARSSCPGFASRYAALIQRAYPWNSGTWSCCVSPSRVSSPHDAVSANAELLGGIVEWTQGNVDEQTETWEVRVTHSDFRWASVIAGRSSQQKTEQ